MGGFFEEELKKLLDGWLYSSCTFSTSKLFLGATL